MEAVAACTALADCVAARAWMATVVKQIRAAQPPAVVDKWFGVKRAPQPDRVLGFIGKRLWLARQQLARAYLARLSAEDSGCEGRTTAFVVARTITEIKSWDASSPRLEGGAGAPLRLFDGVAPPQRVLGLQVLQDEAPSIEGFVVQQVGFGKWWALKWDSLRRASPGELAAELRGKKVVLELFPDPGDGEELQPLYRINACPSLDVVPRARRLAVLAHEALHHYPAGVEHAGGPVTNELDSEQLAKKRPGLALDNAPNFQYMIENLLHFMPVPEEG
uniref:Uncharacterized protein n=1 Tax=Alexandrium catenella TaxID=2925 RepID=A0A7S1MIQ1_ALECA